MPFFACRIGMEVTGWAIQVFAGKVSALRVVVIQGVASALLDHCGTAHNPEVHRYFFISCRKLQALAVINLIRLAATVSRILVASRRAPLDFVANCLRAPKAVHVTRIAQVFVHLRDAVFRGRFLMTSLDIRMAQASLPMAFLIPANLSIPDKVRPCLTHRTSPLDIQNLEQCWVLHKGVVENFVVGNTFRPGMAIATLGIFLASFESLGRARVLDKDVFD
mmetsp:Transcript_69914/g.130646  ORF Transcript_69914/g.130646 Transcript_69914/m.130646 type:complete len:221 (+) Transcript_69914:661-1323(+)